MKVGTVITIEIDGFHIPYITPPLPKLETIQGYDLPKKKQKWTRQIFPDDREIKNYSEKEKKELIKTDMLRRINGHWFMNNGEPTYITGSHYLLLTHWYMAAVNKDGYPEYRNAARLWYYVKDLCDKDEECFGAILMCQKRFGKTEMELADLYNKATRGGVRVLNKMVVEDVDCLFGMQSLTSTEAKNNLFKSRLMRSHKRIPNYLKPVSNETKSKKEIVGELTFMGENIGEGRYKDALINVIDHRPTLVSAYQGKRPRQIFIDEPGSIEEMDLIEWWGIVKEQLALGTKAFGKAFLPTTLESMTPKGAAAFQTIWDTSNPEKRDANGRTESGLYRYFKPQYLGREDFIDEYGNDLIQEAKQFRANSLAIATIDRQRKIKSQYPETIDEAFDRDFGDGFSAEAIEVFKRRRLQIRDEKDRGIRSVIPYNIFEYGGEIHAEPKPSGKAKDSDIIIHELPRPNVQYGISVDGTGTDKQTTDSKNKKSKYAVSVTKLFDPDPSPNTTSYCDVAELELEPEKQEKCFRLTFLLCKLYSKYKICKLLPEGNIGTAAPIVGYFQNRGAINMMLKQPKYLGTDSTETMNRYCCYRDGTVLETQIFLVNQWAIMYGHNCNSEKLLDQLISYPKNIDLGAAFMMAVLTWGGFAITDKQEKPKRSISIIKGYDANGKPNWVTFTD